MNIFSPDSKLYKAMVRLTDAVKLNFLWIAFSLPVVTLGASTIAAFDVAMRFVDNTEGDIAKDFWKAFKSNLKQGIPMTFITLLCAWAIYLDFQIFSAAEEHGTVFLIIGIIAAYVFVFSLLYTYPLLARYENTIFRTIKNSFRISMKYFIRSLIMLVLAAAETALFIWNTKTLILGIFFGPVIVITTMSWFALNIFRDIEKDPAAVAHKDEKEQDAAE